MRESTFVQDDLHLGALQGINEARRETYMQYGDRQELFLPFDKRSLPHRKSHDLALELITQQSPKTLGGLRAPHASRTRGCKSS
jgi:hypothetical protein